MEMIETSDQTGTPKAPGELETHVDRVLQILKSGLSEKILAAYKSRSSASLDTQTLRILAEITNPTASSKDQNDKTVVKPLDLNSWLGLILRRWDWFAPDLKDVDKSTIEKMQALCNSRQVDAKVSNDDARYIVNTAHKLLSVVGCKLQLEELSAVRDRVLMLISEVSDTSDTPIPNIHLAQLERLAENKPSEHAVSPLPHVDVSTPTSENKDDTGDAKTFLIDKLVKSSSWMALDSVSEVVEKSARTDKNQTRRISPPGINSVLQVEIVAQRGMVSSQRIGLNKASMFVGRSAMADIEINDPLASRIHLVIAGTLESGVKITDLRSANGTTIDGVSLEPNVPTVWSVGQIVTIGETLLILRYGE